MQSQQQPPTKAAPVNEAVRNIAETVNRGQAPTTDQLTNVIDRSAALVDAKQREAPLSATGREIAQDIKQVLADTRQVVQEKNEGEKLQRLIGATRAAGEEISEQAAREARALGQENPLAKQDASLQALQASLGSLRDVALDLVRSRELRDVLVEMLELLQEGLHFATRRTQSALESAKRSVDQDEPESVQGQLREASSQVQERVQASLDEAKQRTQKAVDEVRQGGSASRALEQLVPLSDEQKARLRARVQNLTRRLRDHPEWRRSSDALWGLFDSFRELGRRALDRAGDVADQSPAVQEAWQAAQELLEAFAPGIDRPLDRLRERADALADSMTSDERFRSFWRDLRAWFEDVMRAETDAFDSARFDSLLERAQSLAQDARYRAAASDLTDELQRLLDAMRQDPTTQQLSRDVQQLLQRVVLDEKGDVVFKPEELRQLKILLSSLLLEELKYVPLQRLEGSTDEYDFVLKNGALYAHDLLPEHIQVRFESDLDVNLKEVDAERARTRLSLAASKMRTHMRNTQFWFRKKRGLIRMEDSGVVDVDVAGDGASVLLVLEWDARRKPHGFAVRKVSVDIDQLKVHVQRSHHDWLLNVFSPIISRNVKRSIEKEIETRMRLFFEELFMDIHHAARKNIPKQFWEALQETRVQLKDIQAVKDNLEPAPHSAGGRPLDLSRTA